MNISTFPCKIKNRHKHKPSFHLSFCKLLQSLELSNTFFQRGHMREGKHSQRVPNIRPLRITQAIVQCEHKGQRNGLILHIKELVSFIYRYRDAIYHPDLSIFQTFYISTLPARSRILLTAVPRCQCCSHLRISPSRHGFKNAVRLKKTARKNVRKSREGESRREREKTKENEFLPGRRYGQVTRAVMEADTACIPISDLPIRVACLFRGRQIRTPR